MGLDAVELVMAVEEKFAISITDEEATKIRTVGDLKCLVTAKLDVTDVDGCLTQRAFHLIRKNAIAEFGILRRNVRPDTMLESVVPQSTRRESWQNFQVGLGVAALPELVRPHTVNLVITVLVLSGIVVPVWYGALHSQHFGLWMLFGVVLGSFVGWGSALMTKPMKTEFGAGYERVKDLARFLVARHPQQLGKPRTAKWTQEEISCALREVIIDKLGVANFDDNSRFIQDLHID
jgi:predicted secreted protein